MFPDAASWEGRRLRGFRTGSVGKDPHGDAPERRGPLVVVLPQPEPGNELGLAQQQLNSAHFLFHVSKDPADVRKSSGGPDQFLGFTVSSASVGRCTCAGPDGNGGSLTLRA